MGGEPEPDFSQAVGASLWVLPRHRARAAALRLIRSPSSVAMWHSSVSDVHTMAMGMVMDAGAQAGEPWRVRCTVCVERDAAGAWRGDTTRRVRGDMRSRCSTAAQQGHREKSRTGRMLIINEAGLGQDIRYFAQGKAVCVAGSKVETVFLHKLATHRQRTVIDIRVRARRVACLCVWPGSDLCSTAGEGVQTGRFRDQAGAVRIHGRPFLSEPCGGHGACGLAPAAHCPRAAASPSVADVRSWSTRRVVPWPQRVRSSPSSSPLSCL